MLGFGPIGSSAIGALPDDFSVTFDLGEKIQGQSIIEVVSFVDRSLLERLQKNPDDLRLLDRRKFEELVAELFLGFGYEVELTQRTRDGGKDVIAIKRAEVDVRFLIACRRPNPGNPVRVSAVRELYGVKVSDGASKAIFATTTHFTEDAKLFSEKIRWDLELRDFEAIKEWIANYLALKG
jgi:restriction endonuclease Mrr